MAKNSCPRSLFEYLCIVLPNFLGFFLFCFLTFPLSNAQTPPPINMETSITAGNNAAVWSSPSGEFVFGFYPTSSNWYLVGIWFDKIPEKTLVWSANRDDPAEAGSTIRLTPQGLELTHRDGTGRTWSTAGTATSGFMQNDGNFVLRDSALNNVWQSFGSPTDTILPGQVFGMGQKLFSNANGSVGNYSTGNYMLELQSFDGNLVLSTYHLGDPGYWFTNTRFTNGSLIFSRTSALMYVANSTGHNIHPLSTKAPTPVEDYYHRATIDDRGNFQQYAYHKTDGGGWKRVWRAVEPCDVYSICGIYGLCTSRDNETVTCSCLPGYISLEQSDHSKGCRPRTVTNYCKDGSMRNYTVELIADADFPPHNNDLVKVFNVDAEGCRKIVVDDCYTIAGYLADSTCYTRRAPLLATRRSASTQGRQAFIKVPLKMDDTNFKPEKNSKVRVYLKAGLLTTTLLAALFGFAALYYLPVTKLLSLGRKYIPDPTAIGINFREFTYKELQEATSGFSNVLGRGSSGRVYPGILHLKGIQVEIAVKQLDKRIEKSEKEFMTELKILGRKYHKNLVRILGFCVEDNHLLLVYELMKNGTLSSFLFKEGQQPIWGLRYEMALGIAKGLLYLHEECETQIIHCDIKPQNVLLDHSFGAKIADFGLSKLLKKDQTRTDTNARGTIGYMAPEWLKNAPITTKVDVYSFGVMALEIGCARRHIDLNRVEEESEKDDLLLIDWVLSCVRSRNLKTLAMHDPEILSDLKRFERLIMVGLWCVFPDPILRPSMKKVVQMLDESVEVDVAPLVYHE